MEGEERQRGLEEVIVTTDRPVIHKLADYKEYYMYIYPCNNSENTFLHHRWYHTIQGNKHAPCAIHMTTCESFDWLCITCYQI